MSLTEDEGDPILMSHNGCYLVVATTTGCILVIDLSHRLGCDWTAEMFSKRFLPLLSEVNNTDFAMLSSCCLFFYMIEQSQRFPVWLIRRQTLCPDKSYCETSRSFYSLF